MSNAPIPFKEVLFCILISICNAQASDNFSDTSKVYDQLKNKLEKLETKMKNLNDDNISFSNPEKMNLSSGEISVFREHLSKCWYPKNNLSVDVSVFFDADGNVIETIADAKKLMKPYSEYSKAVFGAKKALLACSPFPLPKNKFKVWEEMILSFQPQILSNQ